MTTLQAWQIVGEQLWFVVGALSVPVGWATMGAMVYRRDEDGLPFCLITCWTFTWTLYFIVRGWPL